MIKAKRVWMPLFIADYTLDTKHLSTEQHGAYFLLIMNYWVTGGLPHDDTELARLAGLPLDQWLVHKPVIQRFFHRGWKHKRLDAEIDRATDLIRKRRAAGSKGGTVSSIRRTRKIKLV
jgi:uncharacterized protein YdaU (DUF1376 family)